MDADVAVNVDTVVNVDTAVNMTQSSGLANEVEAFLLRWELTD